jgi:hypothetical protein
MRKVLKSLIAVPFLYCWTSPASADYVLLLKNGRSIIVQNYREEDQLIKFHGLGGEIGIGKDQIQSIRKAGEQDRSGLTLPGAAPVSAPPPGGARQEGQVTSPPSPAGRALTPAEEKAKEEKEYQQKLMDVTRQLKDVEDRYSQSIRGTTTPDPNLQWSEEQRAATREDAISRFREATSNPSEPAPVRLLTPSPFSTLPPTITEDRPVGRPPTTHDLPVTGQQRESADFRNQMIQLEKERDRLINEIKEKNLGLGSAFRE